MVLLSLFWMAKEIFSFQCLLKWHIRKMSRTMARPNIISIILLFTLLVFANADCLGLHFMRDCCRQSLGHLKHILQLIIHLLEQGILFLDDIQLSLHKLRAVFLKQHILLLFISRILPFTCSLHLFDVNNSYTLFE